MALSTFADSIKSFYKSVDVNAVSPKQEETPESEKWATLSAAVSMVPFQYTAVDAETAKKVQKLLDKLEEDDDVQNVYHNWEMPEED